MAERMGTKSDMSLMYFTSLEEACVFTAYGGGPFLIYT